MLKKTIAILFLSFAFLYLGFAQGTVRGKVVDFTGEPVTGATIVVKGTTIGVLSDFDGNYSLRIPEGTNDSIRVSFVGLTPFEEKIAFENDNVVIVNVVLQELTYEGKEVVIYGKKKRDNMEYAKLERLNANISKDIIPKELISRTGDSDVGDAIKRVPGVSTVGGYLTVRGLADRYIKTTINGSRIPTLDPIKNNIKLDMFPTALIDNIEINKSISAELPGDWAGSYVSIETKDYPEKMFVSVKSTFGYNPNSSFTDIVSSKGSKTDWLGFDNGYRDIQHPVTNGFPDYNSNTNPFNEFTVLGIGDALNSRGIDEEQFKSGNSKFFSHEYDKNIYYRYGLVELGLLKEGLIYNDAAVWEATEAYENNPEYKDKATKILNADHIAFAQSIPDNWLTTRKKTFTDFSQDITLGNQVNFFNRPLGILAGFRYSSSIRYDPSTTNNIGFFSYTKKDEFSSVDVFERELSKETYRWSALINLAYKINSNNSFSFLVMPNFTGENSCSFDSSIISLTGQQEFGAGTAELVHRQQYEERQQLIYQYSSKHYFPELKIKIKLDASYTKGKSVLPGFSDFNYFQLAENNAYVFNVTHQPKIRYRYLNDDILDSHFNLEIPIMSRDNLNRKLKLGGDHMQNFRVYEQYNYFIQNKFSREDLYYSTGEMVERFAPVQFETISNDINFAHQMSLNYINDTEKSDFITGRHEISAVFAMLDFPVTERIRLTGGIRIDNSLVKVDLTDFFHSDIVPDDPLRYIDLGELGKFTANPNNKNEIHYLPSTNLIFKLFDNEKVISNVRFGYGKTLGRYSLREVSATLEDNFDLGKPVRGNPELKMATVDNYDFRFEAFFTNGDNISLSSFYKEFQNHIELEIQSLWYTWINSPDVSKAYGFELEGKKSLFEHLDVMGNFTYIYSRSTAIVEFTDLSPGGKGVYTDTIKRVMYGQSPYIVNGIVSYFFPEIGMNATLSYNVQGPKLIFVTLRGEQPDVFELPRNLIDLKINKSLGKHFNIEFKIRDLLNTRVSWAYDFNNYSEEYRGYKFGPTYGLGISYEL